MCLPLILARARVAAQTDNGSLEIKFWINFIYLKTFSVAVMTPILKDRHFSLKIKWHTIICLSNMARNHKLYNILIHFYKTTFTFFWLKGRAANAQILCRKQSENCKNITIKMPSKQGYINVKFWTEITNGSYVLLVV